MLSYMTIAKRAGGMAVTSSRMQTQFVLHEQGAKRRNSMTELERIKNIEEQITLARLLPDVNLDCLPPEEFAKLKRAALNLYRLGHASGFRAGSDHAMNAVARVIPPRRNNSQKLWLMRRLSARICEYWQEFKSSLLSIRVIVIRSPRRRRYQTAVSSNN